MSDDTVKAALDAAYPRFPSVIWKFPLPSDDGVIDMPTGAQVLSVGEQARQLVLWAAVVPDVAMEPRRFMVVGTGEPFALQPMVDFVGTVQMPSGLVWHVIEVAP